jgi:hypothetical protein
VLLLFGRTFVAEGGLLYREPWVPWVDSLWLVNVIEVVAIEFLSVSEMRTLH